MSDETTRPEDAAQDELSDDEMEGIAGGASLRMKKDHGLSKPRGSSGIGQATKLKDLHGPGQTHSHNPSKGKTGRGFDPTHLKRGPRGG